MTLLPKSCSGLVTLVASLAQFGDFTVGVSLSLVSLPTSLAQFGESCSVW